MVVICSYRNARYAFLPVHWNLSFRRFLISALNETAWSSFCLLENLTLVQKEQLHDIYFWKKKRASWQVTRATVRVFCYATYTCWHQTNLFHPPSLAFKRANLQILSWKNFPKQQRRKRILRLNNMEVLELGLRRISCKRGLGRGVNLEHGTLRSWCSPGCELE